MNVEPATEVMHFIVSSKSGRVVAREVVSASSFGSEEDFGLAIREASRGFKKKYPKDSYRIQLVASSSRSPYSLDGLSVDDGEEAPRFRRSDGMKVPLSRKNLGKVQIYRVPASGDIKGGRQKLAAIEGIGPVYAKKLKKAGIQSTDALLKEGASPKGRKGIAERAGLSAKQILEWVNHVDLFRVKGVGSEYADLLEAAGVDTVPELAQRSAANLYQKMLDVNKAKKLVRRPPAESMVGDWVKQAKKLPRVIEY